jgi:hypothetical protein
MILDIFNSDAFSVINLTLGILKRPYVPGRLSPVFRVEGISTWIAAIEQRANKLALIPAKTRRSGATTAAPAERETIYPILVPHLPYDDALLAADVQGVREFGSSDQVKSIQTELRMKLEKLRQDHEVTHEYHRVGAIQGVVKDADGITTLHNLFTIFGITEEEVEFDLDVDATDVKAKCREVRRIIRGKLGGRTSTGIVGQCGEDFWSLLVSHPEVKAAHERLNEGAYLRQLQIRQGAQPGQDDLEELVFGNIHFQLYEGQVGDVPFIPTDQCRFYPTGVPDLFVEYYGPADFEETVNTRGLPFYAKQERMKFGKGIEIHTQSNPCVICSEPEFLVKGITNVPDES